VTWIRYGIALCLLGLVLYHPQASARILIRQNFCCMCSEDHTEAQAAEIRRTEQLLGAQKIYIRRIEGTAIYVVSATGFTEAEAQQKLERSISEVQKVSPLPVRYIDGPRVLYQKISNWAFLGIVVLFVIGALSLRLRRNSIKRILVH
jgi:hypothetical protein